MAYPGEKVLEGTKPFRGVPRVPKSTVKKYRVQTKKGSNFGQACISKRFAHASRTRTRTRTRVLVAKLLKLSTACWTENLPQFFFLEQKQPIKCLNIKFKYSRRHGPLEWHFTSLGGCQNEVHQRQSGKDKAMAIGKCRNHSSFFARPCLSAWREGIGDAARHRRA